MPSSSRKKKQKESKDEIDPALRQYIADKNKTRRKDYYTGDRMRFSTSQIEIDKKLIGEEKINTPNLQRRNDLATLVNDNRFIASNRTITNPRSAPIDSTTTMGVSFATLRVLHHSHFKKSWKGNDIELWKDGVLLSSVMIVRNKADRMVRATQPSPFHPGLYSPVYRPWNSLSVPIDDNISMEIEVKAKMKTDSNGSLQKITFNKKYNQKLKKVECFLCLLPRGSRLVNGILFWRLEGDMYDYYDESIIRLRIKNGAMISGRFELRCGAESHEFNS